MPPVPLGLYVHVPFCARTCDYCVFYQISPTGESIQRFLAGIAAEAAGVEWTRPVATVFWGGGTPGLLAARDLRRLGEIVRARCGGPPREWTVEMTPGVVTEARLGALRELGVTRISMGVQSFQPALLAALGRPHTRDQVYRAYDRVRAAGFASVNLDLMFAVPGQRDDAWAADVNEAVALGPDHLSAYCLTFEEDTRLWVKLAQGQVRREVETEARLYLATWAQLAAAGYAQYEVSNFARPGHACLHNLHTWRMYEWIGLGPSAASQHAGGRGANPADLDRWLAGLARGERATEDRVRLTPALLAEDALIFGLRMNEGVDVAAWRARVPAAPWPAVEALLTRLADEGLAVWGDGRVSLTVRGRLVADAVGVELMTAFAAGSETTNY
jgi:oxygen-independent coproporphyrinogen-3 oxidase